MGLCKHFPSFMLDFPYLFFFYPILDISYHLNENSPLRALPQGSPCGRFSPVEEERPKSSSILG
jgi:hypothetical protein